MEKIVSITESRLLELIDKERYLYILENYNLSETEMSNSADREFLDTYGYDPPAYGR